MTSGVQRRLKKADRKKNVVGTPSAVNAACAREHRKLLLVPLA
jgi:hypothetical protein